MHKVPPSCFVCDAKLEPALSYPGSAEINQPYAATTFYAYGQYGSTVFDPLDASYLELNICDECLVQNAKKQNVLIGFPEQKQRIWQGANEYRYHC